MKKAMKRRAMKKAAAEEAPMKAMKAMKDEGHEEGYEAPRHEEGCRRGGTDEGHEGNESHEGHEEGHEAPRNEGSRGGGTNEGHEGDEGHESHEEGHEGYEGNESYEGHEEGYEGHESHEGHEGNEEVNGWKCESLLFFSSGHERCFASSCGGVTRLAHLYKH